MNRRVTVAAVVVVVAAVGSAPALAKPKPKPKPLKGTFSYTDVTPDPTVTANSDATSHCHGNLPAAPTDVNVHTLTVKGPGMLTVAGQNKLDWAMEVRDSHGGVLAGSDGTTPVAAEGTSVPLPKAGNYQVVYCNLEGEPTITATYTFIYR
jgi:hypothetical protein